MRAAPPVSLFLLCDHIRGMVCRPRPGIADNGPVQFLHSDISICSQNIRLVLASRDLPRIILFGITGVIIASVSAAQRRTAASLRRARDELQEANQYLKTVNERLPIENRAATLGEMSASIAHEVTQCSQLPRTGRSQPEVAQQTVAGNRTRVPGNGNK